MATGFPSGQTHLKTRLEEIKLAVEDGAMEIDVVINRTLVLTGQWEGRYMSYEGDTVLSWQMTWWGSGRRQHVLEIIGPDHKCLDKRVNLGEIMAKITHSCAPHKA